MHVPKVIFFQRKPRPQHNFSIEGIFENLRANLKDKIKSSVKLSTFYNNGYFSKLINIIEAAVRQKNNSIAHITGETHFLNLLMRKDCVLLTIHDCRFMERKTGIQKKLVSWIYLTMPVKKSRYVTTVSESTKKEVLKYVNCNAKKIVVIPNAVNNIFKPYSVNFNKKCPVILAIGTAPNKNLSRLIEAVKNIRCRLIVVGNPQNTEIKKLDDFGINYTIKSNLTKEELLGEYVSCDILSFISTYEGFGMPIIEAQTVGRPVLTSNISSMPEVAGEGACLVDPYNINSISDGLKKIINDDSYRKYLIEKGNLNAMRFDEVKIANQYYNLYEKFNLQ